MSSSPVARRGLAAIPWILVFVLAGINLLSMSRLGPNDDAYITYRVARNLANGVGPVYNPGERVLTVTTPGYMLMLAAASVFSHDFVFLGLALNGLALLAVGVLVIDLSSMAVVGPPNASRPDAWRPVLAATVAVSLTLTFPLLSAAVGMETPLFMAAILAAFAAYRRALQQGLDRRVELRWLTLTALSAALAFLFRPDGILVALAIGIHWIGVRRRAVWQPVLVFAALSLPWLTFAWLYYGSPVPNTLVAKETQALGEAIPRWGPGLWTAAGDWARQFPVAAILAGGGLVLALLRRQSGRVPMLMWAGFSIAAHTMLGVRSYFWYYAPFIPVAGLLAGDAASFSMGWLSIFLSRHRRAGLATMLVALSLAMAALAPAAAAAVQITQHPGPRRREQAYLRSAEVLRELCASRRDQVQIGMAEIGLIGYVSDCPIVDFAGLLQPEIAHLQLPVAEKTAWAIQHYRPEAVVLAGGQGFPSIISNAPWFKQRYEPVDHQEINGFRSLVYKRGLGPEMQRDLPHALWWRLPNPKPLAEWTLFFEPGAIPSITLHAFLPIGSSLALTANGQPVASLTGSEIGWQEVRLPPLAPIDQVRLGLVGSAGDQPAMAAWIESNALSPLHYFVPLEDASTRPVPTIPLEPGASRRVRLARPDEDPAALEVQYRDRPGVRLALSVDGVPVGVVGGTDSWRIDQLPLPDRPVIDIELRNQGDTVVRVSHVALVKPFDAASPEE